MSGRRERTEGGAGWYAGAWLLMAALLLVDALPASGQERPRCTLSWEPATEDTRSVSVRDPAGGHLTYVGGGMVWTCGTAVMQADSAVHFEAQRRVELLGDVRYRDTIRTLQSGRLDYYQVEDRVVATGDVLLTRLGSGSTLEGPRVEFLRAVSGDAERTIATGRPHMVLRSEGDPDAPPLEVDADRSEFAGEERAAARGDVVIRRPDLLATADSAFFDLDAGEGVLHGDPVAEGERFELSGDTLRLHFTEGEVEEVWALGTGRAAGEDFEVLSEVVRIQVEGDEVEAVWAYGGERSMALSGRHRLYGDSLRFYLLEGALDTIVSVGNAVAVDEPEEEASAPPEPVRDSEEPEPVRDSEEPEEAASAASGRTGRPATGRESRTRREEGGRIPPPALTTERATNWVTGDTLWAIFETVPPEEGLAEEPQGPPEVVDGERGEGDPADADREDAEPADAPERPEEEAARRERESRLERLRVVGNARAFYAAVRDTMVTRTPSRNYLVGREIEILFEDGEARRVLGRDAIGVYLDPLEEGADAPPPQTPPEIEPAPDFDPPSPDDDPSPLDDPSPVDDPSRENDPPAQHDESAVGDDPADEQVGDPAAPRLAPRRAATGSAARGRAG